MRITRLVATLATVGLVGTSTVLLGSAPAQAATVGSVVTVSPLTDNEFTYGDDFSVSGTTKAADGTSISTGTVTLFVSTPATPAFTPVATDDTASYWSFYDVKPQMNSTYKVVYSGGTTSYPANTVTVGESAPFTVTVARTFKIPTPKGLTVRGKVVPDYAKGKIKVLQLLGKKGTKVKPYAKVKTDKKSRFSFKAPNRRGFQFVLVVPGDAQYAGTYAPYHVY